MSDMGQLVRGVTVTNQGIKQYLDGQSQNLLINKLQPQIKFLSFTLLSYLIPALPLPFHKS